MTVTGEGEELQRANARSIAYGSKTSHGSGSWPRSRGRNAEAVAQASTLETHCIRKKRGVIPLENATAMFGNDIGLKAMVSEARFRDFLAEAEKMRILDQAQAGRPQRQRRGIAEARAELATVLYRAGDWLMPESGEDNCSACNCGLEWRLGR
jgi:hypothetical protein